MRALAVAPHTEKLPFITKLIFGRKKQQKTIQEIESKVTSLKSGTLREAEESIGVRSFSKNRRRGGRSLRRVLYPVLTDTKKRERRERVDRFLNV